MKAYVYPSEYLDYELFNKFRPIEGIHKAKIMATVTSPGMTLRDAFALSAMAAIIGKAPFEDVAISEETDAKVAAIAVGAYHYADAMLKARGE